MVQPALRQSTLSEKIPFNYCRPARYRPSFIISIDTNKNINQEETV
jgi:hypothetical protein